MTVISTAGIRDVKRGSTSINASARHTDDQRVAIALVEAVHEGLDVFDEVVPVGGETEQLRELADDDRHAQAHHVADLHLLREQVCDEAQLADPEPDLDRAHEQRQEAGEGDELGRVVGDREREDRGEDQRPERRVGPEDEDARGTEDRVADEARDGRVEAVHGRQAGKLGVGHALGHEDRGQHDARNEVGSQPALLVPRQHRDTRNPATDARARPSSFLAGPRRSRCRYRLSRSAAPTASPAVPPA